MVWWTCPFSTWYFVFDKCNFVFGITDNGLRELGPGRTSGPHGVVHGPHWVLSPIVDVKARLEFVAAVTRAFLNKVPPPMYLHIWWRPSVAFIVQTARPSSSVSSA